MKLPKGLPKWAWAAAAGVGLLIAYFLLHRSSSGESTDGVSPAQQTPSPGGGDSGGGGGAGLGSSPSSPISPVSAPTAGDLITTMQEAPVTDALPASAFTIAPASGPAYTTEYTVPTGSPLSVLVGGGAFPVPSSGVLPSTFPIPTSTPLADLRHVRTYPTPNRTGTPGAYGGVLAPEG